MKWLSRRITWWILGSLVGLIAVAWVAGWAITGTMMPRNTTVAGVSVGSMSPSEAEEKLTAGIADRLDDAITVVHEDVTYDLVPSEVGLEVDVPASIAEAGGRRSWHPAAIWALVVGGDDYGPVLDVDQPSLRAAVGAIAEEVDIPVVEPLITFPDAEPEAREPEAGNVVAQSDLRRQVRDSYLMTTDSIPVPMDRVEPTVDSAGLAEAMRTIAEPAVSAPIMLEVGDTEVELPVTAWAPALTVEVVEGAMAPLLDAEKLAKPLTSSTTGVGRKATNASFTFKKGKPVIVPSKTGLGLDPERLSVSLIPVLTKTGAERSLVVDTTVVEPAFTTEDAEALGIKERISSFSTNYPHAPYRNTNQGKAAEYLNGTVVAPGETFSFNDTVGRRTPENGFVSGIVINGGVFREEQGGGVSQVVTTVYNAAFFAGLDDVEHHPHAFYISRYPMGREATVYYGSLDLRFKNSFETGVLIRSWITPSTPGRQGTMHVEMWGTKVYDIEAGQSAQRNFRNPGTRYDETSRCVAQEPIRGFDIDIYRIFKQNGKKIKTETNTAHYQAADRVICGPKPKPKSESSEAGD